MMIPGSVVELLRTINGRGALIVPAGSVGVVTLLGRMVEVSFGNYRVNVPRAQAEDYLRLLNEGKGNGD